jgi:hypothetical protein
VVATNTFGTITNTVTVVVPPPGGSGISCPGFPDGTLVIDLPWSNALLPTANPPLKSFKAKGALVLRFTVPAGAAPSNVNTPGEIRMVEYADPAAQRYAVLSTTACDFSGGLVKQVSFNLDIITAVSTTQPGGITLLPGTQYFINVRNSDAAGNWSCKNTTCNMLINWLVPR